MRKDCSQLLFSNQRLGDGKGAVGTVVSNLTISVAIHFQFLLLTGHKKCGTSLECEYKLTRATAATPLRALLRVRMQTQATLYTISGCVPPVSSATNKAQSNETRQTVRENSSAHARVPAPIEGHSVMDSKPYQSECCDSKKCK